MLENTDKEGKEKIMDNKKYEAKKDCFAYTTNKGTPMCKALKELYCKKENCKFYKKTWEVK